MRVAMPFEQCWAAVPGGTARTMIDLAAAVDDRPDVDVVGFAARHDGPPPAAWRPPVPVQHLRLPRPVLHEAWHALRRPVVERATGPIDVCHAVGGAIPASTAPLVVTVHDLAFRHLPDAFTRQGRRFFERSLRLVREHAAQVQVPSHATLDDCVAAGIEPGRLRLVPWGCTAPLVVTVHDLAFRHLPEAFTRQGRRFFERSLRLVRRHASQVQVPSHATLDDCVAAGIEPDRLRLVPWGCTVTEPQASDVADVRQRFGLPDQYVVCVGTLEPRKNLRRLLEAWRRVDRPHVGLVVVGPTGWGGSSDLSTPAPNVTMTGFVDGPTRDALYAGAVASCYPSLLEGFGLPVLESMALGCPVVTSIGTATAELVAGGAGVAVDPHDPDAIAGGLLSVLDDGDLRAELVAAGLVRAGEHTWARAAELAVAGYREVLA